MKPSKIALALYLIWVSLHLFLFLTGHDKFDSDKTFWPFEGTRSEWYYDWTELVFYCVIPVILWLVIKLLGSGIDEEEQKIRERRRDLGL